MSYTEIYKFDQDGNPVHIGETLNSHRGAAAIWRIMEDKYLPPHYFKNYRGEEEKISRISFSDGTINEIWNLIHDDNVSDIDKIVLGSTFDNVVIMRKDIDKLLYAFLNFDGDTSLKEQAEIIKNEFENDPNLLAIAWNQTSINGDDWSNFGGYTLDVSVFNNKTSIIEVHDFFSCGLYGFNDFRHLPFMFYRWFNEYINKNK